MSNNKDQGTEKPEMVKVTIQAEAKAKFRKVISMPLDEAEAFVNADDETIICNIDDSDWESFDDFEVTSVEIKV